MKMKIAGLVAALLLIGVNGWAADGDLVVNGKVGVGTSSPIWKLHVSGGHVGVDNNYSLVGKSTAGQGVSLASVDGSDYALLGDSYAGLHGLRFYSGSGTESMRITNTGKVGIGNSNPGYLLTMEPSGGGFYDQSTHNWVSVSSGRWKSNIKPITSALDTVLKLNGVSFKWKKRTDVFETGMDGKQKYISSSWEDDPNGRDDIGLIGEEVMKVLPEVVAVDQKESNYVAGVAYSKMVPLLIEAIKDQQKQIEALKSEVADLKAKQ